jgi:alpha-beta hydrolase superfamily lysophospholipase
VSFIAVFCGLVLGACAPRIAPPGMGARAPVLTSEYFVTADGMRLPLRVWSTVAPPRAVILALHGFNDYSKSFEAPAAAWRKAGIAVYAYDQRGFGAAPHHGLWPGVAAMTGDLVAASQLLRARYPATPIYLVGESMGASVILAAYASAAQPAADGVVLSAPAVWSRRFMPFYQRAALWLGAHSVPWLKMTGRGLKIRASDNNAMLRALGRDPLVIKGTRIDALYGLTNLMAAALAAAPELDIRALILYGRSEQLIPAPARRAMLTALPKGGTWRYVQYESGFHMLLRDLNADIVLRDIATWITEKDAARTNFATKPRMAR